MIQVNRIYLIFNRLVTKKFLVDTSAHKNKKTLWESASPASKNCTFGQSF
jgi:hypothetical protein